MTKSRQVRRRETFDDAFFLVNRENLRKKRGRWEVPTFVPKDGMVRRERRKLARAYAKGGV